MHFQVQFLEFRTLWNKQENVSIGTHLELESAPDFEWFGGMIIRYVTHNKNEYKEGGSAVAQW